LPHNRRRFVVEDGTCRRAETDAERECRNEPGDYECGA
jgi:hypothetical protein